VSVLLSEIVFYFIFLINLKKKKRSEQIRQIGPIGDPKPDGAGLTVLLAHPRRRQRFGSQQTIQQFCSRMHTFIRISPHFKLILNRFFLLNN